MDRRVHDVEHGHGVAGQASTLHNALHGIQTEKDDLSFNTVLLEEVIT